MLFFAFYNCTIWIYKRICNVIYVVCCFCIYLALEVCRNSNCNLAIFVNQFSYLWASHAIYIICIIYRIVCNRLYACRWSFITGRNNYVCVFLEVESIICNLHRCSVFLTFHIFFRHKIKSGNIWGLYILVNRLTIGIVYITCVIRN